jgi:signal transduction histidine kinase
MVVDTGIGIDPRRMKEIFEPFHTTKPLGLGLGLSISRSIVEAHGGRIRAIRNDGPGVTFQFTLPVEQE